MHQGIMYTDMLYQVWKHVSLALLSLLPIGLEYMVDVCVVGGPRGNTGPRLIYFASIKHRRYELLCCSPVYCLNIYLDGRTRNLP